MHPPHLRPLLATLALLSALPALATTIKTGKPAASQPPARTWATRDQLRDCLDAEDALGARLHAIEAANAVHERLFNQVQDETARLNKLQGELDHDSDSAVRSFNALVKEHNEHVRQLNEQAEQSRPVSDAYNADMAAYNGRCAPLVYRLDDLDAVKLERRKRAASAP